MFDFETLTTSLFLGSIVFAFFFLWGNNAIGCTVKIPDNVPRVVGHLPFAGGLVALVKNYHRINDFLLQVSKAYDFKTWTISMPFQPPFIWTTDPKNLEHVLKDNFENYIKGEFYDANMRDLLGNGIFNVDGAAWKSQRRLASHVFNVKNFKEFVNVVFKDEMIILSSKIKSYAENGESFDLQDLFFRFTIDSFAKVAFGIDLNSLNDDQQPEFARALNLCQLQVDWRFYQPLWHLEEKYTSRGQEVTRAFALIHQFGQDVIQERRKEYQSDKAGFEKRSDLLALFMKEMDKETDRADANSSVPQVDADDEAPTSIRTSDQDLGMQVLNFVIAARDTTAQALSWCILMLALHPEAEKNLLEEIATGECDIKEDLSYEEIKGMKYANAVFLETLRLYPSVPKNGKRAIKDDVLPDGTIVPAGVQLAWSSYVQGCQPSIWGSDAEEFKPDRWLKDDFKQPSPFEFSAFHCGPRQCLGKNLAQLEGVFLLVSLLKQFHITVLDPTSVTYENSITLPMKGGLRVKAVVR